MSTTRIFQVDGMTCAHCGESVSAEVGALPGVEKVDVDLPGGVVSVTSVQELDTEAVRAAVDEAGYQLVG